MNTSRRILKPVIQLLVISAMLFSASLWSSSASPKRHTAAVIFPRISITITIGRASKKCGGFGICKITLGTSLASVAARRVKAELSRTEDGQLEITLLEKAPEEGQTLIIDQDIPLSQSIAKKLGMRKATIQRGEYAFSENKSRINARLMK
jgi:hypothetical protein